MAPEDKCWTALRTSDDCNDCSGDSNCAYDMYWQTTQDDLGMSVCQLPVVGVTRKLVSRTLVLVLAYYIINMCRPVSLMVL